MKILIAEDEYYARQRLIKIIRECDMEAELASAVENGREAVDFLEQNTDVDVVLTDIIMPRMNGLELAEYIHVNMPYIQVVIVSGYEEFDYARKAIEYEVKQYIIKPVKRELLLRVLRQLEEKQENFRREVEAGVLERLKKLPNGYTSSKQVLTKKRTDADPYAAGCGDVRGNTLPGIRHTAGADNEYPGCRAPGQNLCPETGQPACRYLFLSDE